MNDSTTFPMRSAPLSTRKPEARGSNFECESVKSTVEVKREHGNVCSNCNQVRLGLLSD